MRVIFFIQNLHAFHYYRSIIVSLHERGHHALVIFNSGHRLTKAISKRLDDYEEILEDAKAGIPNFEYEIAKGKNPPFLWLLSFTRALLNYRRQLLAENQSEYYLLRLKKLFPPVVAAVVFLKPLRPIIKSERLRNLLVWLEQKVPPEKTILERVRSIAPDFVLVSPPNLKGTSLDVEYVKAARYIGIPSAIPVISWDYLGTKGFITVKPDLLLVWNKTQADDALLHHGIGGAQTAITGATVFDKWFTLPVNRPTREEYCKRYGLDPKKPILLYLGSSTNMAVDESWIVEKLCALLKESNDLSLQHVQVVVRPHPFHSLIYKELAARGKITIVPEVGNLPDTEEHFRIFYSSIEQAFAVVVGVNTSGVIESMIAGKPVLAILTDKYQKTQQDTSHFGQLLTSSCLELSKNFDSCGEKIASLLREEDTKVPNRQKFIKNYIRPKGVTVTSGERVVEELERYITVNYETPFLY